MKRFLALAVLLSAPASFAIDGQVLINQSAVMASGGFPYKITQPGSYKLTGNLVGPLGVDIIQILSSNVTLDLNGFNVRCSTDQTRPFGVNCIEDGGQANTAIAVRNGSITAVGSAPNFQVGQDMIGLYLQSSTGATVEDIHFSAEAKNFSINGLAGGLNSIIRRNTFTNGASPGIGCPSLIESNVNGTGSAGRFGTGCVFQGNVGLF